MREATRDLAFEGNKTVIQDELYISDGIPWFRELYNLMLDYGGGALYEEVLLPWRQRALAAVAGFARFSRMSSFDTKADTFLLPAWNLYALSRINDFLLLPFQGDERGGWADPQVTRQQYLDFFAALGFTPFISERFSPFLHEIVRVRHNADDSAPIKVIETVWPGLMFGDMLFSRSGAAVEGGSDHVVKEVAEESTLYFTYRRLHRKTNDLSMGWGSNSQWRTALRRDYECHGSWFYNVDGPRSLNRVSTSEQDRDGLSTDERIELCRNRCFLTAKKSGDDLWPFDDRYEEPAV
jgi:hypothetical protein